MTTLVSVLAAKGDGGFLALLVVIGIVFAVLAFSIAQKKGMEASLRKVAARVGGTLQSSGLFGRPAMVFEIGGRRAWIEAYAGSRDDPPYTRVSVDVRGKSWGTIHIFPEGFGQSFLKMFGAQDIEIGDPKFDAGFVIKATPVSLAHEVFSPERRRHVTSAVYRMQNLGDPRIDLDGGTLSVQVRGYFTEVSGLMTMVDVAREFFKHLFGNPATPGVQLGEVRVLTGGECPVCGTPMNELIVRCETCRTPHHDECWKYMGRCSTYACKGKRTVA